MAAVDVAGEQLAAMYPAPKFVTIAGRRIEIKKAGIRLGTQVVAMGMALGAQMEAEGADELIFADEHPDQCADILVLATGLEREWVSTLGPVEMVDLAAEWLEVNGDFFLRRLPQARARIRTGVENFIGAGMTQSTSSRVADIPAPTTTPDPRSTSVSKRPLVLNDAIDVPA